MRVRRFLCLLLGVWLGASLWMAVSATQSFRTVNAILNSPPKPVTGVIEAIGPDTVRQVLRYQAGETNRRLFDMWGLSQFVIALGVFLLVLFATSAGRVAVFTTLALLIWVSIMHWLVAPRIAITSQMLEFVPPDQMAAERATMATLHRFYSIMELMKLGLIAVIAGLFLLEPKRRIRSETRS